MGANGFYVGPSFLIATYTSTSAGQSTSFSNIGGAVDLGGQAIVGPGLVVGAGFGVQLTGMNNPMPTDGTPVATQVNARVGLRPRVLSWRTSPRRPG